MDKTKYKTTWHLVIEHTPYGQYIHAVYGAALLDMAEAMVRERGGFVRSLCSHGMSYRAGQRFDG